MRPDEIEWMPRNGTDSYGERFSQWAAVHGSGRILMRIECPRNADEFAFRVSLYCHVPTEVMNFQYFDFIDVESAKRFAEELLAKYDVLELQPKQPAGDTNKAAVSVQSTVD